LYSSRGLGYGISDLGFHVMDIFEFRTSDSKSFNNIGHINSFIHFDLIYNALYFMVYRISRHNICLGVQIIIKSSVKVQQGFACLGQTDQITK